MPAGSAANAERRYLSYLEAMDAAEADGDYTEAAENRRKAEALLQVYPSIRGLVHPVPPAFDQAAFRPPAPTTSATSGEEVQKL